jgi:hypothetical protein
MTPENKTMHMPEPWNVSPDYVDTVIDGNGRRLFFVDGDGTSGNEDCATARRIVACVNLCAHIPDLTTAEVVPGEVMALVREALALAVSRNRLTDALPILESALVALARKE